MGSSNTRYVVNFRTQNLSSLIRARSVIRGIEQQSYISFNSASRSLSHLEKSSIRSSNQITRSFDSINRAMRRLGMGGRGGLFSFGGLGLVTLGIGGLIGSVNLLHRAFIQTNTTMQSSRIMIEELLGSAGNADAFIGKMKDLSASFGQDLTETMNASRGLMQVMKQIDTPKPEQLEKVLKMTMAISAMDLENRGLSYTAFSIKEAFTGQGRGDFKSLRNRLEINLGKATEEAITSSIKKGDLDKAIDLFNQGLIRIGINSDRLLRRLSSEGFLQNVNRLSSYILRTFQVLGEPLFKTLTRPFAKFNSYLAMAFSETGQAVPYLTKIGNEIRDSFAPAIQMIEQFGDDVVNNIKGNPNDNVITKFVDASRGSLRALFSMLGLVKSFIMGVFGSKSSDSQMKQLTDMFSNIANFGDQASLTMDGLSNKANELGLSFGNMAKEGIKSIKDLMNNVENSGLANFMLYQAPKTVMDTAGGGMSLLNQYGGVIGNIGSLLLGFATLRAMRNPLGSAVGLGKSASNMITPSSVSSVAGAGAMASNIGSNIIKGSGNQRFGVSPNFQVSSIPLTSQSQLQQEAYKLQQYTQMRGFEQSKRIVGEPPINISRKADVKFNQASQTSWFQGALSTAGNVVQGGFMMMMAKDLFMGLKGGFTKYLPTISSNMGRFTTSLIPIATKLSALVNPLTLTVGAITAVGLKINSEAKKTIGAFDQEDESWRTADQSRMRLNNYKKARSLTEAFAGGVSISELNRQMKVGLHGLPVNKDNYEWFLKYGTDEKGAKAFRGVHRAFEAGLISPTDLKQMSPQMYDIFANKSQEMVHKGEIILNSKNIFTKEVEQQFVDKIFKEIDKRKQTKPTYQVDEGATFGTNLLGSVDGFGGQ